MMKDDAVDEIREVMGRHLELELAHLSIEDVAKIRHAVVRAGATLEQVAQRLQVVLAAFLTQGVSVCWAKTKITQDGDVVLFQLALNATIPEVCRAESAMCDAIAGETYNPIDKAIYFSCMAS